MIQGGGCFKEVACGFVADAVNRAIAVNAVCFFFVVLWGISFCC